MVWKGVKEVGFGYAYGEGTIGGKKGTVMYVVGKYWPAPNLGSFKDNILPILSSKSKKISLKRGIIARIP